MFCLVADLYLNGAVLFKGKKILGIEYESSYSSYNEFPIFSVKMLLDKKNMLFSDIDNFILIGEDKQRFNAILNLNLLELFDHNNRKEIIVTEKNISESYYMAKTSGFDSCDIFLWDKNGLNSFYYSEDNISKTIFSLDENSDIKFFTKLIYDYFEEDFRIDILMAGFNEGLDLYQNIKNSAFDFNADGRVYIKREILENLFKEHFKHEKFGYSIKKIIDDIIIHISNYMKYLTKNQNIVYCGDFCEISFGNRKMLQYIPYRDYFIEFSKNSSYRAEGAVLKYLTEKENFSSENIELEKINNIIMKLFEDFNSEDIDRISKYFYYMNDEVLNNIKHAIYKCSDIKMNFVLKDIALSSSGVKGWGLFYFYFFGKFKESQLPVIYNYKAMMFLSREKEWEISDIEFYSFDNLPILTIELANCCNYKCIMCDTNMQKNRSFMQFETFKNIIDSLQNFRIGTITPFWLGEPLMNPDFDKMIDYAFEQNENNNSFISFTINTNGSLFDKKKTQTILKNSALDNMNENTFIRVHFSIDSIVEETYKKIHRAGSSENVINNILYFLKERKKSNVQ
ncbi:MAG: radical SAM protein, partial [Candidatus Muirbacterium halophilum]|nr:radical SAM protein [Candidatus Muirbacterium halophilum]